MTTTKTPVPRGHCGRCDRCGSTRAHCDGHCPDEPRAHCPGCGAPYVDTVTPDDQPAKRIESIIDAADAEHARVAASAHGRILTTIPGARIVGPIANDGPALETTHAPSYEAGRRDALAQVRAIWQRWMDDDDAIDVDALADIARLFDDDAPRVLTLDDIARLANEWTVEHGRKDPLDLDGPAALGAFVGWLRERVEVAHG